MESVLHSNIFIFMTTGLFLFITGVTLSPQCSQSSLTIDGGRFTLSNMYNDGSILRYLCPEGFYPYPVKVRECYRGKWYPAPTRKRLQCKRVTCPNPNVMSNGIVDPYKRIYYVNDTTTYRCHSDYTFRGSSTRVCQANGKWSGGTPICSYHSDHCPDPGTPPGASRTGQIFDIDDEVTYRCDNNLKLMGSKVRVCQESGQWLGQEPECYADFTYDTPEEVAEAFSSSLETTLMMHEETDKEGKRIKLDQGGKLDIYIALDTSDSIDEEDFDEAKSVIKQLIEKIRYYQVSPNYEIIIFAGDVTRIVSINDYKRRSDKKLEKVLEDLEGFKYNAKGNQTGTNIAKAYKAILDSISFEKARDEEGFNHIYHVIIMFTDGISNMGGDPNLKVNEIKQVVYNGQDEKRDEYLDLYVFGVGDTVQKVDINDWVTQRRDEKHFFLLRDMENVQETFDQMIDEGNSVSLCGLYKDYDDGTPSSMRRGYPWLIKIDITHEDGTVANCLGSLVTPTFILTAAHCFRFGDTPENIKIEAPNTKDISFPNVKEYIPHPKYQIRGKVKEGITEFYEYDVALIELEKSVIIGTHLRPICIPCTKETSGALRLSSSDVTCERHREELMNNDLVKANFLSSKQEDYVVPKRNVEIKQGNKRTACIEDAKKELKLTDEKAKQIITDNFLCTGGIEQNHLDDVSCKGDSGGATFVEQKHRLIQVGIISWGIKDVCNDRTQSIETARDFHTNLFSPEVQVFLKKYLGDGKRGAPLTFL